MRERTPGSRRRTYIIESYDLGVGALHAELLEVELDAVSDLEVIVLVLVLAALVRRDQGKAHGLPRGLPRRHVSLLVALDRKSLDDAT